MARPLTVEDVEAGLIGGLLLSAGGSGRNAVEKNRGLGFMAVCTENFVRVDDVTKSPELAV
jgi:hypothetical protein